MIGYPDDREMHGRREGRAVLDGLRRHHEVALGRLAEVRVCIGMPVVLGEIGAGDHQREAVATPARTRSHRMQRRAMRSRRPNPESSHRASTAQR